MGKFYKRSDEKVFLSKNWTFEVFFIYFFQAGAERKVSFDWGPDGSKAEDCFFGIVALDQVNKYATLYTKVEKGCQNLYIYFFGPGEQMFSA